MLSQFLTQYMTTAIPALNSSAWRIVARELINCPSIRAFETYMSRVIRFSGISERSVSDFEFEYNGGILKLKLESFPIISEGVFTLIFKVKPGSGANTGIRADDLIKLTDYDPARKTAKYLSVHRK